ncbi:flagellar hook-basal body complex protein FliE [Novosphingobium album (ex Hu et al. 2023)]|uniref:Flagellar hook-basal body complex protein FliE n=1 Tax=Novosphingobium album (ex Hu et al. 2023) TaxID=2930093 RepID=A0ABT0AZX1_9SPHN|nr:flagellar hook-basal body complex protein FliE [Novosphingobium album (ex Hu et al. 2023)]MCJ2178254.1 flagellar hook-basal body complex protein FliE [Novosphingobium album (ex Hu et al. 2023)]
MSGISGIGGGAGGVQQIMQMRQQIIQRNDLLKQLHSTQGADASAVAGPAQTQEPAQGFADTLKNALDGVKSVQAKAEGLTEAYQKGEVTDVAKVMLARQEAGVAFEATLQVRNKLLSAYQDIMRMGV